MLTLQGCSTLPHLYRLLFLIEMLIVIIVWIFVFLFKKYFINWRRIKDLFCQLDKDVRNETYYGTSNQHEPKFRTL